MNQYVLNNESAVTLFGYNAVEDKGRRQAPKTTGALKQEEKILTFTKRRKLQATTRDQQRNITLLAWMIRKHLDYVSRFDIHVRTGIDEIDQRVEKLFAWHGRKINFDVCKRHDRNSMMRMFEACKVIDGDCGLIKTNKGALQAIESDRIAKPDNSDKLTKAVQDRITPFGLILDSLGAVEKYCVVSRNESGLARNYEALVNADDMIFDGYFGRFDQTRGISPLASALNMSQDVSESLEWSALKVKVHSLFGLAFMRDANSGMRYNKAGYNSSTANEDTSAEPYNVQLDPNGILNLDLKPGDKAETIESKTPSHEMLGFTREEIRIILLALDIPFTAYDSMASSFSARIADRTEYEESASEKRRKNQEVLREYSDWRVGWWSVNDQELARLIEKHKKNLWDIQTAVEWIPAGTPWIDKSKELDGDIKAISLGVDSAPRVAKRRGLDAYQIIDEQAEFLKYAKSKGVPITTGTPGQAISTDEPEEPAIKNKDKTNEK